ncbi:MAG: hypothetical protein KDA24_12525 [Deltaproteobacteria bacterium]|nr:hypothetical protein [Deltaproteobacteria bacterium]
MRLSALAALLLVPALVACPPARTGTPGTPGTCDSPDYTVTSWTLDTGMGVNVCIFVENNTSGTLYVSEWRDWDLELCGGGPNDLTPPESHSVFAEIPAGTTSEVLGWNNACAPQDATTVDGQDWEPQLVFYVSADIEDDSCWNEARSPRLQGWYCEG